jgi:hypothetical protein
VVRGIPAEEVSDKPAPSEVLNMTNETNHADIETAVDQLTKSEKGMTAARYLLIMLEGGAISLDEPNQAAVQTILAGAWGGLSGTALDALRDRTGN